MKIPETAIIPETKLTRYLLVFKARNDKCQYLSQAGFTLDNWQSLKKGIQEVIKKNEANETSCKTGILPVPVPKSDRTQGK